MEKKTIKFGYVVAIDMRLEYTEGEKTSQLKNTSLILDEEGQKDWKLPDDLPSQAGCKAIDAALYNALVGHFMYCVAKGYCNDNFIEFLSKFNNEAMRSQEKVQSIVKGKWMEHGKGTEKEIKPDN